MYRVPKYTPTSIDLNQGFEGETIEQKIERALNNKEGITDGAPKIYTDRKDGVRPEFNIRTDKFDRALEAKEMIDENAYESRKKRLEDLAKKQKGETEKKGENETKSQSTQGTTGDPGK